MKDIEIGPIRPPSESNSLLIRVTRGCHWNKCYFCGLYKSMQFSMRPIDETIEDIRQQAQFYQGKKINSCFLQDGDALVLKTDYLLRILDAINQYFPDIQYITSYARADSITRKTPAELKILRQAGLNHLYCGMETEMCIRDRNNGALIFCGSIPVPKCWLPQRKTLNPRTGRNFAHGLPPAIMMRW